MLVNNPFIALIKLINSIHIIDQANKHSLTLKKHQCKEEV